jgi:hypothetical protein
MMRNKLALAALILLSACGKSSQPGPVQDASMTLPPFASASAAAFEVQPITPELSDKYELAGAGCTFLATGAKDENWAVVTRDDNKAWFMTGGALVTLHGPGSPDASSKPALDRYDSELYSLRIARGPGAQKSSGDSDQQEASVSILDKSGKELYQAKGTLTCGG